MTGESQPTHAAQDRPSAWVERWAGRVHAGGTVLDVACGSGRHARFFAARGHAVAAVDRDAAAVAALRQIPDVTILCADIEGGPWPYAGRAFDAVVVTNYLHRPLFPALLDALAPGGVLIYETFAAGNERYGRPSNPDFLLRPGELLEVARGRLRVLAFEQMYVETPKPAMVQRICAIRAA
jgi:SAM-dependent methyltransferase